MRRQQFFISLAIFLAFSLGNVKSVYSQIYADTVLNEGPCNPIVPLVCPSGVIRSDFAVDQNSNTFATLETDIGINSTSFLDLGFTLPGFGGDEVGIVFEDNSGILNANVLATITIEIFDENDNLVGAKNRLTPVDIGTINSFPNGYVTAVSTTPGAYRIKRVRISLGGLAQVINRIKVYGAFYSAVGIEGLGFCEEHPADQLINFGPCETQIPVLCPAAVSTPEHAVDVEETNFATLSVGVGVASTAFLELGFTRQGNAEEYVGFVVESGNKTLGVAALEGITMSVMDAFDNVIMTRPLSLLTDVNILETDRPIYVIGFQTPEGDYDISKIRIELGGLANVLTDLRVYKGFRSSIDFENLPIESSSDVICNNEPVRLTGADGFSNYRWFSGEQAQSIQIESAGMYSVIAFNDETNCFAKGTKEITQSNVAIEVNMIEPLCQSNDGKISVSPVSENINYLYNWSTGVVNNNTIEDLEAGIYKVTVSDQSLNCSSEEIIALSNDNAPSIASEIQHASCDGDGGSITISSLNEDEIVFPKWSNGSEEMLIENLVAGQYELTVTNVEGCASFHHFEIEELTDLGVDLVIDNQPSCNAANGIIEITGITQLDAFDVAWNDGNKDIRRADLPAGTYGVTITNIATGCFTYLEKVLSNIDAPVIEVLQDGSNKCFGQSNAVLEINLPQVINDYHISWSNGLQNVTSINNLSAGKYTVQVELLSNNCKAFHEFEVIEPSRIEGNASIENSGCTQDAQIGSIELSVLGGLAPYSYEWSNGSTSNTIESLSAGKYECLISDAIGCSAFKIFQVRRNTDCDGDDVVTKNFLSPNNDGENDTWLVPNLEAYPNNEVKVFNRWGDIVFDASPYKQDWDGSFQNNGTALPDGNYFYVINLNNVGHETITGFIAIIR